MKSVNCSKPGFTSITCSKISNIPYNLIFTTKLNDSSILITIISCDYLHLSLANEYVDDVTIPTQVIEYNQNFLQADQPIRLQYSNQIKLLVISLKGSIYYFINNIWYKYTGITKQKNKYLMAEKNLWIHRKLKIEQHKHH